MWPAKVSKGRVFLILFFAGTLSLSPLSIPNQTPVAPTAIPVWELRKAINTLLTRERPGPEGWWRGNGREAKMQKAGWMTADEVKPQTSCSRELWGPPHGLRV